MQESRKRMLFPAADTDDLILSKAPEKPEDNFSVSLTRYQSILIAISKKGGGGGGARVHDDLYVENDFVD